VGTQFVRETPGILVVGVKMLISVFTKFSVRMWAEFVWLWRVKAGSLLWLCGCTLGFDKFESILTSC
jgi:hypothetical protein